MDYKTLHGGGSRVASSRSIVGSNAPRGRLTGSTAAVLEGAFETIDEVEGLLAGVAEGAPPDLVEPALVALTSGGSVSGRCCWC